MRNSGNGPGVISSLPLRLITARDFNLERELSIFPSRLTLLQAKKPADVAQI
jgi:hypothetical protein